MKRKTIFYVAATLMLLCGFGTAGAQGQAEKMKQEYEGGNRKPAFLKEYVALLKTEGDPADVAPVLDDYLMALPAAERYGRDNLADVAEYMDSAERRIVTDIVLNWDKIKIGEEPGEKLGEKLGDLYVASMFEEMRARNEGDDAELREYPIIPEASPFPPLRTRLVEMWPAYGQGDTDKLICGLREVFTLPETGSLVELFVLGGYISSVLENADLGQSRDMVELLGKTVENYPDGQYSSILRPIITNFEGKIMMIEAGEE